MEQGREREKVVSEVFHVWRERSLKFFVVCINSVYHVNTSSVLLVRTL